MELDAVVCGSVVFTIRVGVTIGCVMAIVCMAVQSVAIFSMPIRKYVSIVTIAADYTVFEAYLSECI